MRANQRRLLVLFSREAQPSFALLSEDGREIASGPFPSEAPLADAVLVTDYALLSRSDLFAHSGSQRIGLTPPRVDNTPGAALQSARMWLETPASKRTMLAADELELLSIFMHSRSSVIDLMKGQLGHIRTHLGAVSPEYLEILSQNGRILPQTLPLLRDYPTPQHMRGDGLIRLTNALGSVLGVGHQPVIDRLLALRDDFDGSRISLHRLEYVAAVIPMTVESYLLNERVVERIDRTAYRLANHGSAPESLREWEADKQSSRISSLLTIAGVSAEANSMTGGLPTSEQLHARVEALYDRVTSPQRSARADFEEYQLLRTSIECSGDDSTPAQQLRLEIVGQRLALSAGNLLDAIRYRTAAGAILAEHRSDGNGEGAIPASLSTDASLAMAITEASAIDVIVGFPALMNATAGARGSDANPGLLSEALGFLYLSLVFFGEHGSQPSALLEVRSAIEAHGQGGAARAAADIAHYFLVGSRPDTPEAVLEEARFAADEHSRGTVYRSYYHYVAMVVAYVTKDSEMAYAAYAAIKTEGSWPRYNRRFYRLARFSFAIHNAARGDIALSRRELTEIKYSGDQITDGADHLIRELFELRLDLAVGQHGRVLEATLPDGHLSEQAIIGVHLRRYAPVTHVLRGTALIREGAVQAGHALFARATLQSAMSEEWLGALAVETSEFRSWLESLDEAALPDGLTPELRSAILSRPVFLRHTIPALTEQQYRVLTLLAKGRSTNSIASELHITSNTLKTHLRTLYRRLEVSSREQAVLKADAYGLFE